MAAEDWTEAVAHALRERRIGAGQRLFRQGDAVFGIFVVVEGRVRLLRHTADGREIAIHIASAGESFAEAALFSDVYHCEAVADVDSRVTVVPKTEIVGVFRQSPEAAMAFMARLARQVQALRQRLEIRNIRSAEERVHQFLLLSAKAGLVEFDRPLKDIAAEIGLSHEATYRALAHLARRGLISRDGRTVRIVRPAIPAPVPARP